ncbi:hypothetical protein, partial [Rheinheimera faecalis]|uniref:hypothetical protein n=1 Tax=Rheinheimera faecalis TaxID=2901141 RepID=UPI001E3E99BE
VMWALEHNRMIDVEDANVVAEIQLLKQQANTIEGYNTMREQTKRGIADLNTQAEIGRQQRAVLAGQIQERWDENSVDFRMDNPAYRAAESLFNYEDALAAERAMWGDGKIAAQSLRDGISATGDMIEGSARFYAGAFDKAYNSFDRIMNKGFDSLINQPADGVRTITDSYSLSAGYSTYTLGGDITFAFQSDGKVAVGWATAPAGFKADTGRGFEFGYTQLHWDPAAYGKNADAETVLGGYGTTGGLMINAPRIGAFGRVESTSWESKPFSSDRAAIASGYSYSLSLSPKVDSVLNSPITPVANASYGGLLFDMQPVDLGWFGKLLYWGRQ